MSLVHDDPRPALPVPRGLVFAASGWIAVSWIIAIGVQPPLQPSSAVYTPAARMLLASMVIGGVVAFVAAVGITGGLWVGLQKVFAPNDPVKGPFGDVEIKNPLG